MLLTEVAASSRSATPKRVNQDGVLASCSSGPRGALVLLAVADGVGGLDGGDLASLAAISSVARHLFIEPLDLDQVFTKANDEVIAVGSKFPKGAASTLSVVAIENNLAHVATSGDTLVALIRRGELMFHSTPDVAVSGGITRFLGSIDAYRPARVDWQVESGDFVVVCSDGIWRFLEMIELSDLSVQARTLREFVSTVVERARDAGSDDDATIAVARIGS